MKATNLHLNLLREQERLSSSPVRLRVMGPVLMALACVGCLVWWGSLFARQMLKDAEVRSVKSSIASRKTHFADVLKNSAEARELQAELDQMEMYRNGRQTYGELFARLAEVMPTRLQIWEMTVPPPPAQDLTPPGTKPGVKPLVLLQGPTGTVEKVSLHLVCRAPDLHQVDYLVNELKNASSTNGLPIAGEPKVFVPPQQGGGTGADKDYLKVVIDYDCHERRFEK